MGLPYLVFIKVGCAIDRYGGFFQFNTDARMSRNETTCNHRFTLPGANNVTS